MCVSWMVALSRSALSIRDVTVGPGRQQYMHTISVGAESAPPMVLLPGYGAGKQSACVF